MAELTLKKNPEKSKINNSGTKELSQVKLISSIKTSETFKKLFPINEALLDTITTDMKENGFDEAQPLLVWKEQEVLIDGHTRLQAAIDAGLQQVPVYQKSFQEEAEAIRYVIHLQIDRRNITDAELYHCIIELDKRNSLGGDRKSEKIKSARAHVISEESDLKEGTSREKTAKMLGTSTTKIQKVRTINDYGSERLKEAVLAGQLSINKAYQEIKEKRKEKQATHKNAKNKYNAYWADSTLHVDKNDERVVALELKLNLNDKAKEKIKRVIESHTE